MIAIRSFPAASSMGPRRGWGGAQLVRRRPARAVQALCRDGRSNQRGLTNSFFLTLNTGIVALVGALKKLPIGTEAWWPVIPLVALLGQCFAWFYLVRSYRLLNGGKIPGRGCPRGTLTRLALLARRMVGAW
jgi:hypothetical protein